MELKLTDFLREFQADPTRNLAPEFQDGCARFILHQICELAADCLQKSKDDDALSSAYFYEMSASLEELLVEVSPGGRVKRFPDRKIFLKFFKKWKKIFEFFLCLGARKMRRSDVGRVPRRNDQKAAADRRAARAPFGMFGIRSGRILPIARRGGRRRSRVRRCDPGADSAIHFQQIGPQQGSE